MTTREKPGDLEICNEVKRMRPLIVKTARMLTDCMDVSLGLTKMDENRPEYRMLDAILTDDMARAVLKLVAEGHDLAITPRQAREHRCLGCGVTWVDPNRCIGCRICTTRCMFGAIRLERSHPEFENYLQKAFIVFRIWCSSGDSLAFHFALRGTAK